MKMNDIGRLLLLEDTDGIKSIINEQLREYGVSDIEHLGERSTTLFLEELEDALVHDDSLDDHPMHSILDIKSAEKKVDDGSEEVLNDTHEKKKSIYLSNHEKLSESFEYRKTMTGIIKNTFRKDSFEDLSTPQMKIALEMSQAK